MFSIAVVFSVAISSCFALVDFTHSTLYDIKDFVGQTEIFLPKCDNGCLIFASTMGCGFVESPSDYDPYSEKLIIHGSKPDQDISITDLSRKYDEKTGQKTALTISGPTRISVQNKNAVGETSWPIALYVVEKAKAAEFDYSMYDALNLKELAITPSGITTVLSAYPFTLKAQKSGSPNGVSARLTGFDNALASNSDACAEAFSMAKTNPFPGFVLNIAGPLISLAFTEQQPVQLDASIQFIPAFDFADDGFITSAGYNGCKKPLSGGVQTFRSSFLQPSDIYQISSTTDQYRVSINVQPNLDENHKVTIDDVTNNKLQSITGTSEVLLAFENTDYINIVFNGLTGDQGFLLRYTSQILPKTTTTTIKSTITISGPMITSSTPITKPTTSGTESATATAKNDQSTASSTAGALESTTPSSAQTPTTSACNNVQSALASIVAAFFVARFA